MKKRIISWLIVLCLVAQSVVVFAAETAEAPVTEESVEAETLEASPYRIDYEVVSGKAHVVNVEVFDGGSITIEIPSQYNGYPVTTIDTNAFGYTEEGGYYYSKIDGVTKIDIPESVTTIAAKAFYQPSTVHHTLKTVEIQGFASVGESAFEGNKYLKTVTGTKLNKLSAKVYKDTALTNYTLPSNDIVLHTEMFAGTKLTEFTMDKSYQLDSGVFKGCTSLKKLTIQAEPLGTSSDAFDGVNLDVMDVSDLSYWESMAGAQNSAFVKNLIAGTRFYINGVEMTTYSDRSTRKVPYLFYQCPSITRVDFDTARSASQPVGASMFEGCPNLKEVHFNQPVALSANVFKNCPITEVHADGLANYFGSQFPSTEDNPVNKTKAIRSGGQVQKDLVIPAEVTSMGGGTLECLTNLESITIPKTVTSIQDTIPNKASIVVYVEKGSAAQDYCAANGYYYIVTDDDSANYFSGTVENPFSDVAWSVDRLTGTLTITANGIVRPYGSSDDYPWMAHKRYIRHLILSEGITELGNNTFCSMEQLRDIRFPSTLQTIGEQCFNYARSLQTVELPKSVTTLDFGAFSSCTGLKTITLKGDIANIKGNAFEDVKATVYYPAGTIAKTKRQNYGGELTWIGKLASPQVTLSAIVSTGGIKVSWKAVAEATGYEVYRIENGSVKLLKTVTGTYYNDNDVKPGSTYTYQVVAVSAGDRASSDEVSRTATLPQPKITKITTLASGLKLTWSAAAGAGSYNIYRATGTSTKYTKIDSTTKLTYTDATATKSGTNYKYKVYASKKVSGKTVLSAASAVKARIFLKTPAISSVANKKTSVQVKWAKIAGAKGYEVRYSTKSSMSGAKTAKVTRQTYYTNIKLPYKNKTYYFQIRAYATSSDGTKMYTPWSAKKTGKMG